VSVLCRAFAADDLLTSLIAAALLATLKVTDGMLIPTIVCAASPSVVGVAACAAPPATAPAEPSVDLCACRASTTSLGVPLGVEDVLLGVVPPGCGLGLLRSVVSLPGLLPFPVCVLGLLSSGNGDRSERKSSALTTGRRALEMTWAVPLLCGDFDAAAGLAVKAPRLVLFLVARSTARRNGGTGRLGDALLAVGGAVRGLS